MSNFFKANHGVARYDFNHATLQEYNDHTYKLTVFKYPYDTMPELRKPSVRGEVNTEKLRNNLSRTKSTIFELAMCNPWEYFVTLTIDGSKHDRSDLASYEKALRNMIKNYNARHNAKIRFLLIPEFHSDKINYHMHGLMMGIPQECLEEFTADMFLPESILKKVEVGKNVNRWKQYADRFGHCIVEAIQNADAVSKYMTKYITEELGNTITELNAHAYYCSRGLARAKTLCEGPLVSVPKPDYENDYVAIKTFKTKEEASAFFFDTRKETSPCFYQNIFPSGSMANA